MKTDHPDFEAMPPPWVAFTGLSPAEPANQGAVESYILLEWLPFWLRMSDEAKEAYLDRWEASDAWRAAIAERYGPHDLDYATEAEQERIEAQKQPRTKRTWFGWRPFPGRGND